MPPRESGSRSTRSVRARPPPSTHSKASTSPTDADHPSLHSATSSSTRNRRVKEEPDDGTHLPEEKCGRSKRSKGKQKAVEIEEELVPAEQENAEGEGEEEETRCVCGRNGPSSHFFFLFQLSCSIPLMALGSQMRTLG